MDNNRSVYTIYTDGSSLGNPGHAAWAVLIDNLAYTGYIGIATNNQAEMTAVAKAMELVPDNSDLVIITDSKLVLGWFTRGWKINQSHIRKIKNECDTLRDDKSLRVQFVKTKGHASDQLNNRVDALARSAARSMSGSYPQGYRL